MAISDAQGVLPNSPPTARCVEVVLRVENAAISVDGTFSPI